MQHFKPHGYQRRGIDWIIDHKACGLFLPMGAGKTITTLTALQELLFERFEISRVLIIGPKRVIETTWPDEIGKWQHTRELRFSVISGSAAKRIQAMKADAEIYLIGKENVKWLVNTCGRWKWDCVVIDELSTFKNPQSKRFKALKTVRPLLKRFIGLTGTPTPKGIPDLYSQIYLMDGGQRLGKTLSAFRAKYLKPGRMNGFVIYDWVIQPEADKAIQKQISDICMSIDQSEYATLPDCQILDYPVDLKGDLKKYRNFKREMVLEVGNDESILASSAGVLCGKLSQFTSGQIYGEDKVVHELHTHKLDALLDLMESANGQPVLVFYWFQHERDRIRQALEKAGYHGKDIKDGRKVTQEWNAGKLDFLLLNPASAGHGLNLQTGGHIAIWYSLPGFSLELYQQANARIYRQGQKEKCLIYHLVAKGTIDTDMLEALKKKEVTQAALLDALRKDL